MPTMEKIRCTGCGQIRRWVGYKCLDQCPCLSENRCPCGGVILADTEDWKTPRCYQCWWNLGSPENEPENLSK